MSTKETT